MVSFVSFLSVVAALPVPLTRSSYPGGGASWQSSLQQGGFQNDFQNGFQNGSPWMEPRQAWSPWQGNPQQGDPWMDSPQQGSPWKEWPQQGGPWKGTPPNGNPWETPQHGSPWEESPQQGSPWPDQPQHDSPQPSGFDINDMLQQVNQVRAKAGARPLRVNEKLMTAAQRHSQDQASTRRMSHTGSDGSDVSQRSSRVGYNYRSLGENVAWNQRSVSEVMQSWIKSPGHYANLINPQFEDFGAGMVDYYWTQNFGS